MSYIYNEAILMSTHKIKFHDKIKFPKYLFPGAIGRIS